MLIPLYSRKKILFSSLCIHILIVCTKIDKTNKQTFMYGHQNRNSIRLRTDYLNNLKRIHQLVICGLPIWSYLEIFNTK